MTRAVCPGSFDPVTWGHLDVIGRAARIVDQLVVAVGGNVSKTGLFTAAERVEMVTEQCRQWPNVTVEPLSGLLVDFCRRHEAALIVKGVRARDIGYETQMAHMNAHLTGVDTVFLPAAPQWSYVSSTLVREVAALGGDISGLVPDPVERRVRERIDRS